MRRTYVHYWVLDEAGRPQPVDDVLTWARWFETAERTVASDHVGDVHVSTVFLALDHAFGVGPPVLWETMIFGGALDQECWRYTSREAAIAGHAEALALVHGDA